ncbi:hypothetical protein HPT25_01115 [Bacillus sp. BRMEA1]|uniref:hypothetical protein n=1 Tax=Neobacillus endophyticus TaxID=2738405 RepID=UPI001566F455|nr:hypothetical protein [Neobacillus endophyticus]NRD76107.1 hypothetical protein [Neobacillus endophyticus]
MISAEHVYLDPRVHHGYGHFGHYGGYGHPWGWGGRPFGYGFGLPFLGGLAAGALLSAPYAYGYPSPYPYPYYPY